VERAFPWSFEGLGARQSRALVSGIEARHGEVLQILDRFGVDPHETEQARVQLAILKLSGGDKGELSRQVAAAKSDFRDLLAYAEYPEQMASGGLAFPANLKRLRQIEEQDREQYLNWLRRTDGLDRCGEA
jgi:hypothetical protein